MAPEDPLMSTPEDPESARKRPAPDGGEWLDLAVTGLFAAFGLTLTVVAAVGGATPVELVLVFVLGAAWTFQWAYTSDAWDWLRRR
jgi:Flp pilus assembly protein TadB